MLLQKEKLGKKIIKFILVLLTMISIFLFSNDNGVSSTKKSDSVIINIIKITTNKKINNKNKDKYINKYVVLVRKSAHFIIYLILGIFLTSLIKEYKVFNYKIIIYSTIIIILYALGDEAHQFFIPGRDANIIDVMIDTCGGLIGSFIYYIIRRRKYE